MKRSVAQNDRPAQTVLQVSIVMALLMGLALGATWGGTHGWQPEGGGDRGRGGPGSPSPPGGRGWVDARSFGARGDGTGDDTGAIQRAIDAVARRGGGVVYFPTGTYIVAPTTQRFLILRSNVHLRGDGPSSVFRIKGDAGDYEKILGQYPAGTIIENITIRDLRFDQNPSGNRTCKVRDKDSQTAQMVLYLTAAQHVIVESCRFDRCTGVNTVSVNGINCKYVKIYNCEFDFSRARSDEDYDNSAIYMHNIDHQVIGNLFRADIAEHARGAVETHNGQAVVSGNVTDGYQTGCNITTDRGVGGDSRENNDITVAGNTFARACWGIMLWSLTGTTCRNVTIAHNTISLAQADHNENGSCGISMVLDKVSGTIDGDYENIVIANNAISYQRETNRKKSRQGYELSAFTTSAIGLAPGGVVRNVLVAGNVIRNAPVKGISLGYSNDSNCENIIIKDNLIVDAGRNAGVERGYRASIFLVGHLADVAVEGNTIIDTGRPPNGYQSFYVYPASATRVSIQDNDIGTKQGSLYDNRDRSKASGPGNRF